jgi:hypothetical protein
MFVDSGDEILSPAQLGIPTSGIIMRDSQAISLMDPYSIPKRTATPLYVVADSMQEQPQGLAFQSHDGVKVVACSISRDALLDLRDYHGLTGDESQAFRALGPQIERLANEKYRAGRLDQTGQLEINPADILLYGFEPRP